MAARFTEMVSGRDCSILRIALRKRFLELRAAILLQRLLGDDQRDQFTLGDPQGGKRADRLGVVITKPGAVVGNGIPSRSRMNSTSRWMDLVLISSSRRA